MSNVENTFWVLAIKRIVTTTSGVQPQGSQPPSKMSVNKPPQAGVLLPRPSNAGPGCVQHQFPPIPKASSQLVVGSSSYL